MASIELVIKRLNGSDDVARKTRELARLAKAKNHTSPDIPAVCFELASEVCSKPLDKPAQDACQKLSGMPPASYRNSFRTLQSVLKLTKALTIAELGVRFGCSSAVDRATEILDRYMQQLLASHREFFDCTLPVFAAAALTMAVTAFKKEKTKIKLDAKRLKAVCGYMPNELKRVLKLFETSEQKWEKFEAAREEEAQRMLKSTPRKRLPDAVADTAADTGVQPAAPPAKKLKAKKKDMAYDDWKASFLL